MRAGAILVAAVVLAGCGVTERLAGGRVKSDQAVPYKATLTASREDARAFEVSTKEVTVPLDVLRESIRYPATRYCLTTFGASDAEWVTDAAMGDWASVTDGKTRVFSGRCTAR